jgi:hypothetical protein
MPDSSAGKQQDSKTEFDFPVGKQMQPNLEWHENFSLIILAVHRAAILTAWAVADISLTSSFCSSSSSSSRGAAVTSA